jgi:hypothetical protein
MAFGGFNSWRRGGWHGRGFAGGYGGWGYGPYYDDGYVGVVLAGLGLGLATSYGYCGPYSYNYCDPGDVVGW